jgi:photosystem II stability/assembly factor-like uncharacterized protein
MKTLTPRIKSIIAFAAMSALFLPVIALANADGYKFVDPKGFADWATFGPEGGDVRAVAIDPRDKDKVYISTADGQIHVSADGGNNWRMLVNLDQTQLVLDQLIVDSRDSQKIYTSGHRGKRAGGFFRSTDGGSTWKESKELRGEAIHAMTQAVSDPSSLFVGSTNGVWVSKNSGEDWTRVESGTMPVNVNSIEVDPKKTSTIYAGTSWRPYKSTDSGQSWRLIKSGMIDDSDIFAITVSPRDQNHIIASACSGIYESVNGGEQWRKIQGIPSTSRRTRAIVRNPAVPGAIYAGTTEGFWMSTTGGKSWMMTTQRNLEINSIAVHPDEPNRIFIGTNNFGVMVSTDGGKNFVPSNKSFTSRFIYSVTADVAEANRLYAATLNTGGTGGGFVFFSADGGHTWTQSKGIDSDRVSPFTILQDRTTPTTLHMGTNLGIYRSIDRGISWTLIEPPKPKKVPAKRTAKGKTAVKTKASVPKPIDPAIPPGPTVLPVLTEKVKTLTFTEDGKNGLFAGTDSGLYRTYDMTKGWEKLPFGEGLDTNVLVVYASPQVPGTVWVGTATSGVIVSRDDGKSWTKIDATPEGVPISSIASDPKRPNYMYVGSINSFYVSRDGGRTWSRRGNGLPLGNYTSILINPVNTDEMFVSSAIESDGGIFYSDDAGNKWKRLDSKDMKIPSRRVWSMAFDPQNTNRIFAGSHSSGVYVIDRKQESAAADATK